MCFLNIFEIVLNIFIVFLLELYKRTPMNSLERSWFLIDSSKKYLVTLTWEFA